MNCLTRVSGFRTFPLRCWIGSTQLTEFFTVKVPISLDFKILVRSNLKQLLQLKANMATNSEIKEVTDSTKRAADEKVDFETQSVRSYKTAESWTHTFKKRRALWSEQTWVKTPDTGGGNVYVYIDQYLPFVSPNDSQQVKTICRSVV